MKANDRKGYENAMPMIETLLQAIQDDRRRQMAEAARARLVRTEGSGPGNRIRRWVAARVAGPAHSARPAGTVS